MDKKTSSSFSLLEVVIAMLILSLVVAGTFGLFVSSHKFVIEAGHRLQAINYARQVAETLRVYVSASNASPAPATSGTGAGCALDQNTNKDPITLLGLSAVNIPGTTGATCTYNVDENVDDVSAPGTPTTLEAVRITVNWTE